MPVREGVRMLFGERHLAKGVALPKRLRKNIIRSRGPKKHDAQFQPECCPALWQFLDATGLRRDEVKILKVGDICTHNPAYGGHTAVRRGKGGKSRVVVVDPEQAADVLKLTTGRSAEERVFARIPRHLDVHAYRRTFAQERYRRSAPDHELPPTEKNKLSPNDYDSSAVQQVTEAFGHRRRSVVLGHYIR